jgi:hypothetical protein
MHTNDDEREREQDYEEQDGEQFKSEIHEHTCRACMGERLKKKKTTKERVSGKFDTNTHTFEQDEEVLMFESGVKENGTA